MNQRRVSGFDGRRSGACDRAKCPQARSALVASLALGALTACSGGGGGSGDTIPDTVPDFGAATFSDPTTVDNPFFPLTPGLASTILIETPDGTETDVVEVQQVTRVVDGVECVQVQDQVFEDGLLIEDTLDFYAQDDDGNVWYLGEEVVNYEYDDDGNLLGTDTDGSWESGKDVAGIGRNALPGFQMLANPQPGDRYHQEYYRGEAEDTGEILALNVPVTLADGSQVFCVQVEDAATLPGVTPECKFYAPGLGFVRLEEAGNSEVGELRGRFLRTDDSLPDFAAATFSDPTTIDNPYFPQNAEQAVVVIATTEDGAETIVIEVDAATRIVDGVECLVVRDRGFFDGLLQEETFDYFAQDDDGNVWYLGESVTNYEYDDEGDLIGTDDGGSWEAGLDLAGTGTPAEPGQQMLATPLAGVSTYQEFYPTEAEDMGYVLVTGVEVELEDGTTFDDCVQILDWNPLEPSGLEVKSFALGIGLVQADGLDDGEVEERRFVFDLSDDALPDFGAATFSDPLTVDNAFFPLTVGTIYTYEAETEDGLEITDVEVLNTTRTILGIACVEVRDTVTLDGLIQEDTFDWYCQDDAGNVWYMGEDSTAYEYDDDGNLIGTSKDGSWEAGLDIDGVGSVAEPGHLMRAAPVVGTSYRQELYDTVAEDCGGVVALGVDVTLSDGTEYTGCRQLIDWNPLEPDGLEYKFYAPGVGLVLEQALHKDETVELVNVTP